MASQRENPPTPATPIDARLAATPDDLPRDVPELASLVTATCIARYEDSARLSAHAYTLEDEGRPGNGGDVWSNLAYTLRSNSESALIVAILAHDQRFTEFDVNKGRARGIRPGESGSAGGSTWRAPSTPIPWETRTSRVAG